MHFLGGIALNMLKLFYIALSTGAIAIFDCERNSANGKYYLAREPSIECYIYPWHEGAA